MVINELVIEFNFEAKVQNITKGKVDYGAEKRAYLRHFGPKNAQNSPKNVSRLNFFFKFFREGLVKRPKCNRNVIVNWLDL